MCDSLEYGRKWRWGLHILDWETGIETGKSLNRPPTIFPSIGSGTMVHFTNLWHHGASSSLHVCAGMFTCASVGSLSVRACVCVCVCVCV